MESQEQKTVWNTPELMGQFFASFIESYHYTFDRSTFNLASSAINFAGYESAKSIVDAGSGTGYLTFSILNDFKLREDGPFKLTSIDISTTLMDHLKSYAAKTQYDTKKITHETIVADLASIPTVPDNSVDLYIASLLLEFVAEPVKVLKEAHRVLKKGGKLAIISAPDIPKNCFAALVIQAAKGLKLPAIEDFLRIHLFANRDLLNGYIKEAGFKLDYQWEESVTVNMKTFEDYKKHNLENPLTLGYTQKLDTETLAKFEARVKEIYEELKKNGEPIISKAVSSICVKE